MYDGIVHVFSKVTLSSGGRDRRIDRPGPRHEYDVSLMLV